jgi:lipoprotein-anchoring transpeptidase ErfK/SrfK
MMGLGKRAAVGAVVAAAVAGAAGFVTAQYASAARMGALTPAPGAMTNDPKPAVRLAVEHARRLQDVRLTIDGVDLTRLVKPHDDGFALPPIPMADGRHRVQLTARASGLFGGAVTRDWSFRVDTSVPPLRVGLPTGRWSTATAIAGRTEPGARVRVRWRGGEAAHQAGPDGRFRFEPALAPGATPVQIETSDAAGNRRAAARTVRLDRERPVVRADGRWVRWHRTTDSPVFTLRVRDRSPIRHEASLDGHAIHAKPMPGRRLRLQLDDLAQGEHRLVLVTRDAAGNRTVVRHRFGIDTTDTLSNELTLARGARGGDVREFAERLRSDGYLRGDATDRYDERLVGAVRRYQARNGFEVDGIARPSLLAATSGKVVVIKHEFRAYVYKHNRMLASFPVAIGAPKFPTPTGTYSIVSKVKDPTWIPPNSPWAEGLEPVPPGDDNPLGPRWIGTSAPAIGFHGTPDAKSIGTAASHGCLRMHFADVKRLYDLVEVGMPVVFSA